MCILTQTFKTVFTLTTVLILTSCSGHNSNQVDGSNPDEPPPSSLEASDSPSLASTDNVPASDLPPPLDPVASDLPPPMDPALNNESDPNLSTDLLPPSAALADTAPAMPIEPAVEAAPSHAPRKIRRASPSPRHESKPHSQAKTARLSTPEPKLADTQIEEPVIQQVEAPPAQQAQLSNTQAAMPDATAAPTVIETPAQTPAQVQNSSATSALPISNDTIKYGIIGAICVLVGYLIYRRRKSS